jgi:predicted component of type VI protein secretion system
MIYLAFRIVAPATQVTNLLSLIVLEGKPQAHERKTSDHEEESPRRRYYRHNGDTAQQNRKGHDDREIGVCTLKFIAFFRGVTMDHFDVLPLSLRKTETTEGRACTVGQGPIFYDAMKFSIRDPGLKVTFLS